jgi:hypothetical protein
MMKCVVSVSNLEGIKRKVKTLSNPDLRDFAEEVKKYMIGYIDKKRVRKTEGTRRTWGKEPDQYSNPFHLKDAINVVVHRGGSVSIGSIQELNAKAPYWKLINNGGVVPSNGEAHFVPGFFMSKMFRYQGGSTSGRGKTLQSGGAVIDGMHYIEATKKWAKTYISKFIKNLNKSSSLKGKKP